MLLEILHHDLITNFFTQKPVVQKGPLSMVDQKDPGKFTGKKLVWSLLQAPFLFSCKFAICRDRMISYRGKCAKGIKEQRQIKNKMRFVKRKK